MAASIGMSINTNLAYNNWELEYKDGNNENESPPDSSHTRSKPFAAQLLEIERIMDDLVVNGKLQQQQRHYQQRPAYSANNGTTSGMSRSAYYENEQHLMKDSLRLSQSVMSLNSLNSSYRTKQEVDQYYEDDNTPRGSAAAVRLGGGKQLVASFDPFSLDVLRRTSPNEMIGRTRASSIAASLPSPRSATFSLFSSSAGTTEGTSVSSAPSPIRLSPIEAAGVAGVRLAPIGTKVDKVDKVDNTKGKSEKGDGAPPSPFDLYKSSSSNFSNFWGGGNKAYARKDNGGEKGMIGSCDVWG